MYKGYVNLIIISLAMLYKLSIGNFHFKDFQIKFKLKFTRFFLVFDVKTEEL